MAWRLKELRTAKKLTQQKVADYLGVTQTTYNYYEKEKSEPTIEIFDKLAKLFNTSIDYIVGKECNLINLESITPNKADMIKDILEMDEEQEVRAKSYLDGLMGR